jgi:hypothetical protein
VALLDGAAYGCVLFSWDQADTAQADAVNENLFMAEAEYSREGRVKAERYL